MCNGEKYDHMQGSCPQCLGSGVTRRFIENTEVKTVVEETVYQMLTDLHSKDLLKVK